MSRGRLEAFSDGVLAIIITIMVLELRPPTGATPAALVPMLPAFFAYAVSYIHVGIYWINHHHLLQTVHRVTGPILLANLNLLFQLSLVPFVTNWTGQTAFAPWPVAAYGGVLLACGCSYWLLSRAIIAGQGREGTLARALGRDLKGYASLATYVVAIAVTFVDPRIGFGLYALIASMWFLPDRRIEKALTSE
jgi:uncharacterized membrane protein